MTSTKQHLAPLLQVALFQGLKPLQITEIAHHAQPVTFRQGEIILTAGMEGDAAYLIVNGNLWRVFDHKTARTSTDPSRQSASPRVQVRAGELLVVEPGSLVGEMAMLVDQYCHNATILAASEVHALRLTRAALYAQMSEDPSLADHFSHVIAGRLTSVADQLRQIDGSLSQRHDPSPEQSPAC